jgi:hypothetical protein
LGCWLRHERPVTADFQVNPERQELAEGRRPDVSFRDPQRTLHDAFAKQLGERLRSTLPLILIARRRFH